jgi:hypothetical protein
VWATQGVVGGSFLICVPPFDIKGPDESAIVDAERISPLLIPSFFDSQQNLAFHLLSSSIYDVPCGYELNTDFDPAGIRLRCEK